MHTLNNFVFLLGFWCHKLTVKISDKIFKIIIDILYDNMSIISQIKFSLILDTGFVSIDITCKG
jgi:hypothetical protein